MGEKGSATLTVIIVLALVGGAFVVHEIVSEDKQELNATSDSSVSLIGNTSGEIASEEPPQGISDTSESTTETVANEVVTEEAGSSVAEELSSESSSGGGGGSEGSSQSSTMQESGGSGGKDGGLFSTLGSTIGFVSPTPSNGTQIVSRNFTYNISFTGNVSTVFVNITTGPHTFFDNDDILLYYNFENISELGDSNSVVHDIAGTSDASISGGFEVVDGLFENTFNFTGVDVTTPSFSESIRTISFFFYTSEDITSTSPTRCFGAVTSTTPDRSFCFGSRTGSRIESGSTFWLFNNGGSGSVTSIKDEIGPGWHHMGLSWNDTEGAYQIYVDGDSKEIFDSSGSNNHYSIITNKVIHLGTYTSGSYDDRMDDIIFWNKSLNKTEIAELANRESLTQIENETFFFISTPNNLPLGNTTYKVVFDSNETESRYVERLPFDVNVTFESPTPSNNTFNNNFIVNISVVTDSLTEIIYETNGVNITLLGDDLVLHYAFDNRSELGENDTIVKDTSLKDSVFDQNDGTATDGTFQSNGKFKGAFNSSVDHIALDNNLGGDYKAIHFWFYAPYEYNSTSSSETFMSFHSRTPNIQVGMGNVGSIMTAETFYMFDNLGGATSGKTTYIRDDISQGWHNALINWNETVSEYEIYIDGDKKVTYNSSSGNPLPLLDDEPVRIGDVHSSSGSHFQGLIDELHFYNKSLSSAEIEKHATMGIYKVQDDSYQIVINESPSSTEYTYEMHAVNIDGTGGSSGEQTSLLFTEISACQEISVSGVYHLIQDIFGTANCINITAGGVILNGDGFTINYGSSGTGNGIYAPNVNNITVRNLTINKTEATGSANYGAYYTNVNNSVIEDVTVNTDGTNINIGIYLQGSSNNEVKYNTVSTNGSSTSNFGVYVNANSHNNLVRNNTISTNGTSDNYGLYVATSNGNELENNTISASGTSGNNRGIVILGGSNTNTTTNTIDASGDGSRNYGVLATSNSNNLFFTSNSITASGTSHSNYGLYFASGSTGQAFHNNITTTGTTFHYGVNIDNSEATLRNNTVTTTIEGIRVNVGNATLIDNTISGSFDILGSSSKFILINQTLEDFNIISTNLSVEDEFTRLNYTINITASGNFSAAVNSSDNFLDVNTTIIPELNVSANVTFFSIGDRGFDSPAVLRNNFLCLDCENFTTLNDTDVKFNTSQFSNLRIANGPQRVKSCQTISTSGTYAITQDISNNANCINITTDDVILDGLGFTVNYGGGGTGRGVNVNSGSNISVYNISIDKIGSTDNNNWGVYFDTVSHSLIRDLTVTTSGVNFNYGMYIFGGSNNTIKYNNVSTNGSNDNYGIAVQSTSENMVGNNTVSTESNIGSSNHGIQSFSGTSNTITNNTVNTGGASSNYGLRIRVNSDGNTITNNIVNARGSSVSNYGVALTESSRDNTLAGNTITTNGISNNHGIECSLSPNNNISYNTINASGSSGNNQGIRFISNSNNYIITHNSIIGNASGAVYGMYFQSTSSNNTVEYNNITGKGTGANKMGVFLSTSSNNNTFKNNIFNVTGTGGISFYSENNFGNHIENNTFDTEDSSSNAVYFFSAGKNTLINGTILTATTDLRMIDSTIKAVDQVFDDFVFTNANVSIEDDFTKLNYTTNISASGDFSTVYTSSDNFLEVDASTITGLNAEANITLFNIGDRGFSDPIILKDGAACSDCANFTSLNDTNVKFNTTGFSSFKIGDSNSCIYSSGDFIVDCSDNCTVAGNYNIGGNDVLISGIGTINITGDLTNYGFFNVTGTNATNRCLVNLNGVNFT